jgi:type I restriction enzyme S subunit
MKLETFFKKFEMFADAPNAVAKMRELVLTLAVQGKLVPQDPNDESATKLLERIQKSTERLIKERAIRRQETEPIDSNSAPFPIPQSWVWTRLGEIGDWGSGSTPSRGSHDLYDGGITWLKSGELNDNLALAGSSETVTELALKTGSFRRNQPGDILFAMYGATIGKAAILAEPAVTNQAVCGCTPFEGVSNRYLFNYLVSQRAAFHEASEGGAQPNLSKVKVVAFPFSLPPLAEQKRIVAKVDELMALCDRLEAQQQERVEKHKALSRASLARFADAPTPANLQFIFHPSFTIAPADLRKSILTLAVQGKLVPQDPEDEPAEKLLSKIEVQKKRLSGSGELKADKKAWLNSSINPPHEIPRSWCWVRLQDVFEISRGGSPRPAGDPRFFGGSIPWITVGEVTKDSGTYLTETTTGLTEEGAERSRFINPGDLLLTNSGATLGVPKISKIRGCMNDGVAVLRQFHSFDLNDFGYLYLTQQTPAFRDVNQGMGQPNLNTPIIAGWFFPLPPLAEQRRIVAKVDELMKLVDALETQLTASRATAANLLAAIVAELTGTPNTAKASVPTNTTTGTGRRGRPPKSS